MVFFNYSTMQMAAKVVYYGPGLCGKTTNLQYIFDHTAGESRGEMVSLATETDRTLFFDLLPIDVGTIAGFSTRIQLYTVPGQVFYNTTRKLVLKGVDGVVFVADSQRPMLQANIDSFKNLEENLGEIGLSLDNVPLVLQYNKRDLPGICTVEELDQALNRSGWPAIESSAITGMGVFESLKMISKLTLMALKKRLTRGRPEGPGSRPRSSGTLAAPASRPAARPKAAAPPAESPAPPAQAAPTVESREDAAVLADDTLAAGTGARPVVAAPEPTGKVEAEAIEQAPNEDVEAVEVAPKAHAAPDDQASEGTDLQAPAAPEAVDEAELALPDVELELEPEVEIEAEAAVDEPVAAAPIEAAPVQLQEAPVPDEPSVEEIFSIDDEVSTTIELDGGTPSPVPPSPRPVVAAPSAKEAPAAPSIKPADVTRTATRRSMGLDALAELEKLREQAFRKRPKPAAPANGAGEFSREVRLTVSRDALARARRVAVTLGFEDENANPLDGTRQVHVDLDDPSALRKLLLHLDIAFDAR